MRRRILLVEDDDNMRFMLQDNLEMAGYVTCALGDGQTALSAFMKEEFDLCVLDVMLPKKDGFTLAADIRKLNVRVPIIFLTAKNLKEDRIHGIQDRSRRLYHKTVQYRGVFTSNRSYLETRL